VEPLALSRERMGMTTGQDCNQTARKLKVLGHALDFRGVFVGNLGILKMQSSILKSFHFILISLPIIASRDLRKWQHSQR
jgi:hypothetical protein